jgi:hypothetical protein
MQDLRLEYLPIIKVEAVFQAESAEEIAANERHGIGQLGHAYGAYLWCWMPMGTAFCQVLAELGDIYPEICAGIQADFFAVDYQPGARESLPESIEGATEGGATTSGIEIRPE